MTRRTKLGDKYRDKITGYEGVATARTEFLSGCFHVCLEKADKDGKPEEEWFDEQRLEPLKAERFADAGPKRGGPGPVPPKASHS